jgi:hypothetical protein
MNHCIKTALLTMAVGTAFAATNAKAEVVVYGNGANAPARCQSFTPGVANTIRNRVVGSENVGAAPLAVACSFEVEFSAVSTNALAIQLWFSNNAVANASVNCTLLTGWQGAAGAVAVNKSTTVANGTQSLIDFDSDDTPSTTDTDLGFTIVGANCTIPTSVVINDTYVFWGDEDGVPAAP